MKKFKRFTQTFALCQNLSGHLEAPADVGVVGLRHGQFAYRMMRSAARKPIKKNVKVDEDLTIPQHKI